jgi:hypothetical protein
MLSIVIIVLFFNFKGTYGSLMIPPLKETYGLVFALAKDVSLTIVVKKR